VKSAELFFDGHALLIGSNNVGKSTICEALDLVLGPDRLNRFPPIDEFDFYNSTYAIPQEDQDGEPEIVPLRIEVVLIEPSPEIANKCAGHLEFWHLEKRKLLESGELGDANPPQAAPCLRIETIGRYDVSEDDFEAKTFFSHSPDAPPGELTSLPRHIKRLFGFLYLRALRTGSRALSLQRGSLLDLILRTKGIRTGLWKHTIDRLSTLDIEKEAPEIAPVLRSVEKRLARYIPLEYSGNATKLQVSELTREHLRKTMNFFLALSADQGHVPFNHAGTGTINTLVLALLSFIADLKPGTVIFAMEEPEIAIPPHTQRRIAEYLLTKTTQAFVTSHSPFVIERFEPSKTLLLSRAGGVLSSRRVSEATGLKDNDYRRFSRSGLSECMLGRGAILVEGVTELHALPVVARKIEEANPDLQPLDISGVAFFDADGESNMPKFGKFFRTLGLLTFAFYDNDYKKKRKPEQEKTLADNFIINHEHKYKGFEDLVVSEVPVDRLWLFLASLKENDEHGNLGVPDSRPTDEQVISLAKEALGGHKGAGWSARLFEECKLAELPSTVIEFLLTVYALFPPPSPIDEPGGQATV